MTNNPQKIYAFLAYFIPVLGWLYVIFFHRKNPYVIFHARQAIGLFLFLLIAFGSWVVVGYALAWIPFGFIFSMALFTLVISAVAYGIIAWIMGMANALRGKVALLPIFGRYANGIPL